MSDLGLNQPHAKLHLHPSIQLATIHHVTNQPTTQLQSGVKVEIKRRWNYKILWTPHKILWALYFFGGPLYIAVETLF